jgi:hypothetical protein
MVYMVRYCLKQTKQKQAKTKETADELTRTYHVCHRVSKVILGVNTSQAAGKKIVSVRFHLIFLN